MSLLASIEEEKPLVKEYYSSYDGVKKLAERNKMTRGEYERYLKSNRIQQPIKLESLEQVTQLSLEQPDKKLLGKRVAGGTTKLMNFILSSDGMNDKIKKMYEEDLMLSSEIADTLQLPFVDYKTIESYCTGNFKRNFKTEEQRQDFKTRSQKRQQETTLKKYGVDNVFKSKEFMETVYTQNHERWGKKVYTQTEAYKQKSKETSLNRYGVENAMKNMHVQNKHKQSKYNNLLKKYGVNTKKELDSKLKEINMRKPVLLSPRNQRNSYISWKPTKRVLSYHQYLSLMRDDEQLNRFIQYTCLIKHQDKITTTELAEEIGIAQHTLVTYKHLTENPYIHVSYYGKQNELLNYVKNNYDGEVQSNYRPRFMQGKELDIYLPDLHLAFEFNGNYWHSERAGKGSNYHADKTALCRQAGVDLFHVFESDWNNPIKNDILKSQIAFKLHSTSIKRFYARKLTLKKVSKKEADLFYTINHIQGLSNEQLDYGLYSGKELVACMGFGRKRYTKKSENIYELIRYATKKYTSVAGGASKLSTHFLTQNPNIKTIESFSNDDFAYDADKSVYTKLGFKKVQLQTARYSWVRGDISISRNKVQTPKIIKWCQGLSNSPFPDATKDFERGIDTERSYMERNGFSKVWRSSTGNYAYVR